MEDKYRMKFELLKRFHRPRYGGNAIGSHDSNGYFRKREKSS
jgi:hypothetical protein